MAYCRFGSSDAYIYHACFGGLVCQSCGIASNYKFKVSKTIYHQRRDLSWLRSVSRLRKYSFLRKSKFRFKKKEKLIGYFYITDPTFYYRSEMLKHIALHLEHGDDIDSWAIERLNSEIQQEGDLVERRFKRKFKKKLLSPNPDKLVDF